VNNLVKLLCEDRHEFVEPLSISSNVLGSLRYNAMQAFLRRSIALRMAKAQAMVGFAR